METTNQPYLFPEVQTSQPASSAEVEAYRPRVPELAAARSRSASRPLLHLLLLAATVLTTTLTGASLSVEIGEPASLLGALFAPVLAVLSETAAGNLGPLANGVIFSFTMLTILGAHELGHYFACRYYNIRATPPFFIPAPPALTPFGTLGAVIRIKEPITTRRALFDIGIAGPLAGFAFALPASVIGLWFARPTLPPQTGGIQFHDPLLFKIVMSAAGLPQWIEWNPIYWAAWGTLLVTALNLFPVGQLDGGHVVYALVGRRMHGWVSRLTCVMVAALAVVSMLWYDSPVWLLWTVVLLFLLKAGHPPVAEQEPLGAARVALAVLAALVFLLCFMPFPITVS